MRKTPVTESGLTQFDELDPKEAVLQAWTDAGNHPAYHQLMQRRLREEMPVLARALDRLAETPRQKRDDEWLTDDQVPPITELPY